MKKNFAVEAWRFIFCIIICLYHFLGYGGAQEAGMPFKGGYLAVEFFFIVSGFLLMQHFEQKASTEDFLRPEKAAAEYFGKKYLRLFPHHAFTLIILAVLCLTMVGYSVTKVVTVGFWEFFMLGQFGFGAKSMINTPAWYVSALLIASFVIYYLLLRNRQRFLYFFAPALICIIYAQFFQSADFLNQNLTCKFLVCNGVFRALAGMSLGCLCYLAYIRLKPVLQGRFGFCSSILELGIFALFLRIIYHGGYTHWDFLVLPLMAVFVTSIFLGNSILSRLLNNRLSAYLGKLSYAVYLNQGIFTVIAIMRFSGYDYWQAAGAYLAAVVVFSVLSTWLVEKAVKLIASCRKAKA